MAVSVTSQTSPYVDKLIVDVDANGTPEADPLSGATTSFIFDIDNPDNTTAVVAKFFNAGSITLDGTASSTEPDIIITCPKQSRQTVTISDGIIFGSGLCFACVTGASTTNNSSPQNTVTIRIMAE